jgi:dTDP-4-amino-4,6-dideoxygalactose transaminase
MGMIPCSSPIKQFLAHEAEIVDAIQKVLASGNYILGSRVTELEQKIAEYCGANYAIGVNSGTDALILAMKAINIGPGDEVITVAHTAIATLSAIIAVGATPVLVDIDPIYWTINPDNVVSEITKKTKAIVAVHIYGQSVDMHEISTIAKNHSLYLIEDCAQAIGTKYQGSMVGAIGDIGCFSFYPTKNLGAIGDGGMVVTNNQLLAERLKRIRQYGWNEKRQVVELGFNSRLDEIQAAILLVKLNYLEEDNLRRNIVAKQYLEGISNSKINPTIIRPNTTHSFHLFAVLCNTRNHAIGVMNEKNINIGIHYFPACHLAEGYKDKIRICKSGLGNTEKVSESVMSLPMFPEISDHEVSEVISAINSY